MVSHGVGLGLDGLGPGAVLAGVGVFAVFGLGMVPRGPLVEVGFAGARLRWDYAGPLGLMVGRHHEAWQGASVTNQFRIEWSNTFPA